MMKKTLQLTIFALLLLLLPLTAWGQSYNRLTDGVYQDGQSLYICSSVTSLADLNLDASNIYCYAPVPPACSAGTFADYNAALHVPATLMVPYFTASYWNNFENIMGDAIEPLFVSLGDSSMELEIGTYMSLNAVVTPSDATPRAVLWSSTDSTVASVQGGLVKALAIGECDIVASCLDKQAVCHVTVTPLRVHITLDDAELRVVKNHVVPVTPHMSPVTTELAATTSNDSVAIARVVGASVQVLGVGEGSATVTIGSADGRAHAATLEVTVYTLIGDVNDDGYVTTADISALIDYLLGNESSAVNPARADVNGDGSVTPADISTLIDYLLGNIDLNPEPEPTAVPVVTAAVGDSAVTVTAAGEGDVRLYVNGDEVSNPYTAIRGAEAYTLTAHATAKEDGKKMSRSEEQTITVPSLVPEDQTFTVNGVTFTMIGVAGGTFMMGSTAEQGSDPYDDEYPVHQVTLDGYSIGETEVTQALWQAVMGSNPSDFTGDLQRPVEEVSWNDCQAFITELNRLTGKNFRLPTEAEWEYAARGGSKSQGYMYAGSNDIDTVAWYCDNSGEKTHPVGAKAPNELGLYDMSGNVWEWCQDRYGSYSSSPQTNPTGPATGSNRVRRGGCWDNYAIDCRVSYRHSYTPSLHFRFLGLRLAL